MILGAGFPIILKTLANIGERWIPVPLPPPPSWKLAGLDEPDGGHAELLGERLTRRPEADISHDQLS
jgi:hypothetical protein